MEPKYYFVYYECEKTTSGHGPTSSVNMQCQAIIDKHPLQFQIDCNKKYSEFHDDNHGGRTKEHYFVISWQQLTLEEYKEFEGKIG